MKGEGREQHVSISVSERGLAAGWRLDWGGHGTAPCCGAGRYLDQVVGEPGEAGGRGRVPQDAAAAVRRERLLDALQQLGHGGHPLLLGCSLAGVHHLLDRLIQSHVGALEALPVVLAPEQGVLQQEGARVWGVLTCPPLA